MLAIGLVCFVAGNAAFFWLLERAPGGLAEEPPVVRKHRGIAPDIDKRIEDEQVSVLRKETLAQSVENLSQAGMFFWPGAGMQKYDIRLEIFPLPSQVGYWDVEPVMSNRRFLKVLDELGKLPKEKASALVRSELKRALPWYKKLVAEDLEKAKEAIKPGVRPPSVGGFVIEPPGKPPTWTGLRFKILTLVLVAGNLELKECRPEIIEIALEAKASYADYRRADKFNFASAYYLVRDESLYSRQILATGLLGTSHGLDAAKHQQVLLESRELTKFDAKATMYDLHGRLGAEPVDFTKGRLTVRWTAPLDDEGFDRLLASAQKYDP
jgi:hypothetical protein